MPRGVFSLQQRRVYQRLNDGLKPVLIERLTEELGHPGLDAAFAFTMD